MKRGLGLGLDVVRSRFFKKAPYRVESDGVPSLKISQPSAVSKVEIRTMINQNHSHLIYA